MGIRDTHCSLMVKVSPSFFCIFFLLLSFAVARTSSFPRLSGIKRADNAKKKGQRLATLLVLLRIREIVLVVSQLGKLRYTRRGEGWRGKKSCPTNAEYLKTLLAIGKMRKPVSGKAYWKFLFHPRYLTSFSSRSQSFDRSSSVDLTSNFISPKKTIQAIPIFPSTEMRSYFLQSF